MTTGETNMNFERIRPSDGIHDTITVNEYRPHGSWLEWYRRKDGFRENVLAAILLTLLLLVYLAAGTMAYYWG